MEPLPVRKLSPLFHQPWSPAAVATPVTRRAEPFPNSILARLDKLDARLKQVEENQESQPNMAPYLAPGATSASGMEASVARRPLNTSSVPSSDRHEDMFMERLQFLETQILEVSREVGKGDGTSSSSTVPSSSSVPANEETKWLLNPSVQLQGKDHVWRYSSNDSLTSQKGKAKNDDGNYPAQMLTTTEIEESMDALEASAKAKNEMHNEEESKKKKVGWKRLCKKWLHLGCM